MVCDLPEFLFSACVQAKSMCLHLEHYGFNANYVLVCTVPILVNILLEEIIKVKIKCEYLLEFGCQYFGKLLI